MTMRQIAYTALIALVVLYVVDHVATLKSMFLA